MFLNCKTLFSSSVILPVIEVFFFKVQIIAKGDSKNAEILKQLIRENGIKMCQEKCGDYISALKAGKKYDFVHCLVLEILLKYHKECKLLMKKNK